jgi:hypothetical protein
MGYDAVQFGRGSRVFRRKVLSPSLGLPIKQRRKELPSAYLFTCSAYNSTLKMKVVLPFKTSVNFYMTTRPNVVFLNFFNDLHLEPSHYTNVLFIHLQV